MIIDFVNCVFPVPIVPIIPVFVWKSCDVSFGVHSTGLPSCSFVPNRTLIPLKDSSSPSVFPLCSLSALGLSPVSTSSFSFGPSSSSSSSGVSFPNLLTCNFDKSPVRFRTGISSKIIKSSVRFSLISEYISVTSFNINPNSSLSGISIKLIESSLNDVFLDIKDFLNESTAPFPNTS